MLPGTPRAAHAAIGVGHASVLRSVEIVATLIIDVPLDERSFRATLMDCSRTSLAGAILQQGTTATHSFGEADRDTDARDVKVVCRPINATSRAAVTELRKHGFTPRTALEFQTARDGESREDAWALVGVYARELQGWIMTSYLDFDEAAARLGGEEGLLHAPVGGKRRGVLISAIALRLLTP